MTTETDVNNQVLVMWREQSRMQENAPEMIAAHVDQIGVYLASLHEMAAGDEHVAGMIQSVWGRVQGMQTMSACQSMVIGTAGIIIPALKIQRDELALEMAKLLETMGLVDKEGSAVQGLIAGLYEGWRKMLDTSDIESAAQGELLGVIYEDIEYVWEMDQGSGVIVFEALRGRTDLTDKQKKAFKAFLRSMGDAS